MQLLHVTRTQTRVTRLDTVAADFAGHIATAVWLRKLTHEAACEALWSYAMACCRATQTDFAILRADLMAEYRRRRDGQDLCN